MLCDFKGKYLFEQEEEEEEEEEVERYRLIEIRRKYFTLHLEFSNKSKKEVKKRYGF